MTRNIWENLELKIVMLMVLIMALLSITVYSIVYNQYYRLTIDKLKEDAIIIHNYAEEVIDERAFFELNTKDDENSELYLSIYSQLDEIRRIANIKYLYTAKQNERGEYIYVVDGLSRDAEDFRNVGAFIEDEIKPQLSQSLSNEIVFGDRIINTEWGIVYVVYFPFHDSDGNVIGAIGMEFDCEYLYESFNRMRTTTIVVSLILMLAFILIAFFVIKKLVKNAKTAFVKMDETRLSMEQDLRKADERTRLMLDSSPICTQIWDRDINTIDCNEAAVKLYGFSSKQEYVDRFIYECSPEYQPDNQRSDEKAIALVNGVFENGFWNGEWMHRIPLDGTLMPSEVTLVRVSYGDDYVVLGYTRDLRKEKEYQQSLRNIALKEQETSKAKSVFLAKMSHEIRTPMNAIIGMSELALRTDEPTAMKEHILTIKQASSNLLAIINDILDFSKIETGNLEIVPVNYSVSALINDVISIIRMRLVDSPVRFTVNTDRNIPSMLFGDDVKIRQALINVLGNAVKFTEMGFISFSIHARFIDDDTVSLVMEIIDSGRGIKKEDIAKLFVDFTQLGYSANDYIEGVGLGLAITNSIVREMGGSISVESEFGIGSAFTITLPQKYSSRKVLAAVDNAENKSVLLCERRETYAKSIIRTVENLDVTCVHITNSKELIKKLTVGAFDFLFISFYSYKQYKETIMKYRGNTKLVVYTEFGESVALTVSGSELNVLAMPVYSVPIANMLNGISGKFSGDGKNEPAISFIAPEAKALVVDDINTNLKVTQGLLLPYRLQVELCDSGLKALEALKSKDYDLVFMDHKMPDMDGVEAARHIRKMGIDDPYYTQLPIVALTANAISGMREMYFENGFNDFLPKPIDTTELNTVLERWIPEEKQKRSANTETHAQINVNFEINGLNARGGISRTGGTVELYTEVLASFCEEGYDSVGKITKCLSEGNLSLLTTYVHGLKTAAAFVGADDLSAAAFALETAGKNEDMAYIEANIDEFLHTFETLLNNIQDWQNRVG